MRTVAVTAGGTVTASIVQLIHDNGGRFLTGKNGRWLEVERRKAHEKVAHAVRDMV
jgi:hypothetical protein